MKITLQVLGNIKGVNTRSVDLTATVVEDFKAFIKDLKTKILTKIVFFNLIIFHSELQYRNAHLVQVLILLLVRSCNKPVTLGPPRNSLTRSLGSSC